MGAHDIYAHIVQGAAQGLGVLDDLTGILLAVDLVLRHGDGQGGHGMEVVRRRDARECGLAQLGLHLTAEVVPDQYAVVRAREGLVGAAGDDVHALPQGVLELLAGYEAENVGRIIPYQAASVLKGILELLDGSGEQEYGKAELGHLGLLLAQELPGGVDVEVPVLVVPWIVHGVEATQAHCAELRGRDVGA